MTEVTLQLSDELARKEQVELIAEFSEVLEREDFRHRSAHALA